jgi:hypothetical protein
VSPKLQTEYEATSRISQAQRRRALMLVPRVIPTMFAHRPGGQTACPRCDRGMTLIGVKIGPAGRRFRIMECVICEHSETIVACDTAIDRAAKLPRP